MSIFNVQYLRGDKVKRIEQGSKLSAVHHMKTVAEFNFRCQL
jgi:hypothetical protein